MKIQFSNMGLLNTQVEEMNSLDEYYAFTDSNADLYIHSAEKGITKLLNECKNETALPTIIEHEVLYNTFYSENKFEFWIATERFKLNFFGFGSYNEMEEAIISYLKHRINSTSNILLKALYNHILWESSLKNKFEFGKEAIDNYLAYLAGWIQKPYEDGQSIHVLNYFSFLKRACISLNWRINDFCDLLKLLINRSSSFPGWFMFNIIEIQYELRKQETFSREFNLNCFQTLISIFKEDLSSYEESTYELSIKYSQYLNLPILSLHNILADFYYRSALKRNPNKSDFLIPQLYMKAIHFFKLGKNVEMVRKLETEFIDVKDKHELPVHTFQYTIDRSSAKLINALQSNIQTRIENYDSNELIRYLTEGIELIPFDFELPFSRNNAFLTSVSHSSIDINNNFKQAKNGQFINPRTSYFSMFTIPYLHKVLRHGIGSEKLSAEILIRYFETKTWLGQTNKGKVWIDLITPGIISFFNVYEEFISNSIETNEKYILPIDSLTTKMEGIMRTFSQLNNISTTKSENDKKGGLEIQTREVFLTELLSENYPHFEKLFNPSEYKFFKTVYLKDGLDLRNNIAHSFYNVEDYSLNKLILVVFSIIRISKYPLPIE